MIFKKSILALLTLLIVVLGVSFLVPGDFVHAQDEFVELVNPLRFSNVEFDDPSEVIQKGFIAFAAIIALIAIAFVVFSGVKLMIARSEDAVKQAREAVTWAVGGFVVALLAFTIIAGTANFLGFDPSQIQPNELNNPIVGPDDPNDFISVMNFIMIRFLGLVGFLATANIVFEGYKWLTSQGNEEKIKDAKGGLKWSMLGLAVILLAFTLIVSVREIFVRFGDIDTTPAGPIAGPPGPQPPPPPPPPPAGESALLVTKAVVNNNAGSASVASFTLSVNGTQVTSGTAQNFAPGTYTISEAGPTSDYTTTFSGACDSSGNVIMEAGKSYSCLITNDDVGPAPSGPERLSPSEAEPLLAAAANKFGFHVCLMVETYQRESAGVVRAIGHNHTRLPRPLRRWTLGDPSNTKADENFPSSLPDPVQFNQPELYALDWEWTHDIGLLQINIRDRQRGLSEGQWIDANNPARQYTPSRRKYTMTQLLDPGTNIEASAELYDLNFQAGIFQAGDGAYFNAIWRYIGIPRDPVERQAARDEAQVRLDRVNLCINQRGGTAVR